MKCAPEVGHPSNSWGFFMSKYTTQFKLSAITAFLERGRGFRHIAARFQMDPTLLRRWVEAYRLHGEASLSSTGGRYSALFKFSVLQRPPRNGGWVLDVRVRWARDRSRRRRAVGGRRPPSDRIAERRRPG